jgi:hypothetical protein
VLPKLVAKKKKKKKTTKNKLLLTEKIQTSCIKNNSYRKKCKIPVLKRFISVRVMSQPRGRGASVRYDPYRTGKFSYRTG